MTFLGELLFEYWINDNFLYVINICLVAFEFIFENNN